MQLFRPSYFMPAQSLLATVSATSQLDVLRSNYSEAVQKIYDLQKASDDNALITHKNAYSLTHNLLSTIHPFKPDSPNTISFHSVIIEGAEKLVQRYQPWAGEAGQHTSVVICEPEITVGKFIDSLQNALLIPPGSKRFSKDDIDRHIGRFLTGAALAHGVALSIPSTQASAPTNRRLMIRDKETGLVYPFQYTQLKLLTQGGEGKIYTATHSDTGNTVVIKINTRAEPADIESGKFLREIRFLKDNAQGAVHFFGSGITAAGEPYIVMEYMNQGTVRDYLKRSSLSMSELIEVCEEIIYAIVTSCQQCGIIHRDIKPENLLVNTSERLTNAGYTATTRAIKSADFGIALRKEEFSKLRKNNDPMCYVGTPEYMPPEVFFEGAALDFTFDVFSLGVTLYQILTGKMPSPIKAGESSEEYINRRIAEQKQPPQLPSQYNPEIPSWLDQLIMRAIHNDPQQRYSNPTDLLVAFATHEARELEQELESLQSQQPKALSTNGAQFGLEANRLNLLRGIIREYEAAQKRFPLVDELRERLIKLNWDLWQLATQNGHDEAIKDAAKRLTGLVDKNHPYYERVTREVEHNFTFDLPQAKPTGATFHLAHAANQGGYLSYRFSGESFADLRSLNFAPLGRRRLTMQADGYVPVALPLATRAGHHKTRIPIYRLNEIPKWAQQGHLLIPANKVSAWMPGRFYSAALEEKNLRTVERDFMLGPLISNQDWLEFLLAYADKHGWDAALEHVPHNNEGALWKLSTQQKLIPTQGKLIDPDLPITHYKPESIKKFIKLMRPGAKLPTLDQLKLAFRGIDYSKWPWGDADPYGGEAALQSTGTNSDYTPWPVNKAVLDHSPYSVFDKNGEAICQINHMIGNVQRPFAVPPEHEARMYGIYNQDPNNMSPKEKALYRWTFGSAVNSMPSNAEQIHRHQAGENKSKYIGLQLVYNLRKPS